MNNSNNKDSQGDFEIKNQTIEDGNQQFADKISNQNRNIKTKKNTKGKVIVEGDIHNHHGILQNITTLHVISSIILLVMLIIFAPRVLPEIINKFQNNPPVVLNNKPKPINPMTTFGTKVHDLGITDITDQWLDLPKKNGAIGQNFYEKLQKAKRPATWYVVSMSIGGMDSLRKDVMESAVRDHGVNVKWAYHSRKSIESDAAIQAQWQMLNQHLDLKDRVGKKGFERWDKKMDELMTFANALRDQIQKSEVTNAKGGTWEFYESHVPHYYMAFLSVPDESQILKPLEHERADTPNSPPSAPLGTFGFVMLYPMLPNHYDDRPAIYLEAPGKITDYYYWAIVGLFHEGVARGYVKCTWALKNNPDCAPKK